MTYPLIQHAFDLFEQRGVSGTEEVLIVEEAADTLPEILARFGFQNRKLLVLHDPITFDVAAQRILEVLNRAGIRTDSFCCEGDGAPPACTDTYVNDVKRQLADVAFDCVLAVGSGTVTDIGKLIAQSRDADLISFATAPSMNGYTSKIAAILKDGVKQTVPSIAAKICVADPNILARSPREMIGAGAGDAYSRFVAKCDWKLSHLLHETTYDPQLAELLSEASALLRSVPQDIATQPLTATTNLAVVLYVTGLAQQAALPGTQASGGEHLVSHYLDMLAGHSDFTHKSDLHGRQVAVGTVFTAHLYEALAETNIESLEIDRLVNSHPTRDELSEHLRQHFRGLAPPVLKRALANFPTKPELRVRLARYQQSNVALQADVMKPWLDTETLTAELHACGAPTTFVDIGVDDQLRGDTVTNCQHVRNRFTCLHLASELFVDNEVKTAIAERM